MMAKGISINIGLNSVDPNHYQGWSGELRACEFDANDMALIAASKGFSVLKLLTRDATRTDVLDAIRRASRELKAGDTCLISYSGHGGQLPDLDGDEDDGLDETWCLYDGQLVDDELNLALSAFAPGVRVSVFSDSCHSGTVVKDMLVYSSLMAPAGGAANSVQSEVYRAMPMEVAMTVYLANRSFYDPLLTSPATKDAKSAVRAACLLISGCEDNQLSGDGMFNGVFTGRLKTVWNGGKFSDDYVAFWNAIKSRMPRDQTPKLFEIGDGTDQFRKQRPFEI